MENVFADYKVPISSSVSAPVLKPKRSAFVFITAETDCCGDAYEDLKLINGIEEVYLSRGAYDIVAKVNGDSLEQLREVIFKRIKNLTSIKSTLTLTVV